MTETCWCGADATQRCDNCGQPTCYIHGREKILAVNSTSWRQQTQKLCAQCFYFKTNPYRLPNREAV